MEVHHLAKHNRMNFKYLMTESEERLVKNLFRTNNLIRTKTYTKTKL
jgi:hypothetical protein